MIQSQTWLQFIYIHRGKLYYYTSQKDTKPKGMINIQGLICVAAELNYKKKYGIKLISPHRTYYLACEDEEEQERWIKEINMSSARNSDFKLHVVDPSFGSEDCVLHDIQKAIDQANDGDHIVLRSGVYKLPDTVYIRKPITIRGVYPDSDLVSIQAAVASKTIFKVDTFNENLTVQEMEKQRLLGSDRCVYIEHVTLCQNAPKDSILFYETTSCLELNSGVCKLDHVIIRASYGNGITVTNRLYTPPVTSTATPPATNGMSSTPTNGTMTVSTSNVTAPPTVESTSSNGEGTSQNTVKRPPIEPTMITISECHIDSNKCNGVIFHDDSKGEISKCIFQQNLGHALMCKDSSDVKIEMSVFSNNAKNAIYLESSKTITVYKNKMQRNGFGGKSHIFVATDSPPCASEENEFY